MFRSSIKLFKIFGIEIRLDYSWFIIFALFAYYFGFSYFPSVLPGLNTSLLVIVTIVTVLLFFFSILFHEMSHSIVAIKMGIPVQRISLFIFGGMAQIEKEPDKPKTEFLMSIAGPLASFILAGLFGIIWAVTKSIAPVVASARYLALINIVLGVFNLLPGYPLDGGRVLRSIIWKATNNLKKATFVASTVGRVIGFLMIAVGIFFIFTGNFINGIWLAFIGWFLQTSAYMSYRQLIFDTSSKGYKVKDMMNENIVMVTDDLTLDHLVNNFFMKYRYGRFPVVEDMDMDTEKFVGVVSIHDVKGIRQEEWNTTTVREIVEEVSDKEIISLNAEVSEAIKQMNKNNLSHLVILSGKKLIGMITKSDVMQFIQLLSELH